MSDDPASLWREIARERREIADDRAALEAERQAFHAERADDEQSQATRSNRPSTRSDQDRPTTPHEVAPGPDVTDDGGQLLTYPEVAEVLRLSESSVRRLAASGQLPRVKVGARAVRFRTVDVHQHLRQQTD